MSSALTQIHSIPNLNVRNDLPFLELSRVLEHSSPEVRAEQVAIVDRHSTDPEQDVYPILTLRATDQSLYMAMDGNRRTLRALLHGETSISAWIGEMDGTQLKNYWVPLNDMFSLVDTFKQGNEELQRAVATILRSYFTNDAAKIAYRNRIYQHNDSAKHLYNLALSLD